MRTFLLAIGFAAPLFLSAQSGKCAFRLPAASKTIDLTLDSVLRFEPVAPTTAVAEENRSVHNGTLTAHVVAMNPPDAKGRRILWFVLDQPVGNLRVDDSPRPLQVDRNGYAAAPDKTWNALIWVEAAGTCEVEAAR